MVVLAGSSKLLNNVVRETRVEVEGTYNSWQLAIRLEREEQMFAKIYNIIKLLSLFLVPVFCWKGTCVVKFHRIKLSTSFGKIYCNKKRDSILYTYSSKYVMPTEKENIQVRGRNRRKWIDHMCDFRFIRSFGLVSLFNLFASFVRLSSIRSMDFQQWLPGKGEIGWGAGGCGELNKDIVMRCN